MFFSPERLVRVVRYTDVSRGKTLRSCKHHIARFLPLAAATARIERSHVQWASWCRRPAMTLACFLLTCSPRDSVHLHPGDLSCRGVRNEVNNCALPGDCG